MSISPITKAQLQKIIKAAAYVGASALISGLIAAIAANPLLFGVLTPVINVILVTIKQAFTAPQA
ncbi:hypothetical protein UFOVP1439_54 [uncultured Caudovirales phage]|uniref:Uncharacterized protein n=1 Tax=uncultured Caudovirales phage TaxID=2100421 RepID=A0A6J5SGB4_9CAUD|nr:hypothetical protein UFOVP1085_34 [uncultured Caudovirales phage]CAB4212980.1 hypothetical protein UFOVP1439_54 [uncultured Caudovirales phage]